ncbi:MAG: tetratricopeptide repeat protein, partial [Chlamydiia bacterium]|nr:tetratricopeptide repeat protein [Chlamydiia bacterium]
MWLTSSIPAEFREPGRVEELLEQAIAAYQSTACEAPSLPHLSPTTYKTLYAFAYRFYRDGVYDKAADFFRFLCLMKLDEKKHWVGLGAAEHMRGNYDQALQAYAMAALLDASDPFPHFHAAECYVKQR